MGLFESLVNTVRDHLRPPPRPDAARFSVGARAMALRIRVNLTPPKSADVVARELTYTVGGQANVTTRAVGDPPFEFLAPEGSEVSGSVVDIDGNSNRSEPSTATFFTALDTFPPLTPDAPTFEVVGQE